jgi:hypothetical protein
MIPVMGLITSVPFAAICFAPLSLLNKPKKQPRKGRSYRIY